MQGFYEHKLAVLVDHLILGHVLVVEERSAKLDWLPTFFMVDSKATAEKPSLIDIDSQLWKVTLALKEPIDLDVARGIDLLIH